MQFQPTLSFGPSQKTSQKSSTGTSLPRSNSNDADERSMPPPALPTRKSAKSSPAVLGGKRDKGKGKARAPVDDDVDVEVIEMIDSDEDEPVRKGKAGKF